MQKKRLSFCEAIIHVYLDRGLNNIHLGFVIGIEATVGGRMEYKKVLRKHVTE